MAPASGDRLVGRWRRYWSGRLDEAEGPSQEGGHLCSGNGIELITATAVTPANTADAQPAPELINDLLNTADTADTADTAEDTAADTADTAEDTATDTAEDTATDTTDTADTATDTAADTAEGRRGCGGWGSSATVPACTRP